MKKVHELYNCKIKICEICGCEITKGNQFTQNSSYTRHDKENEVALWTEIKFIGYFEYLIGQRSIKPLCKECAIKLLENTIKTLRSCR